MIRLGRALVLLSVSFAVSDIAMAGKLLVVSPTLGQCDAQFTRIQDATAAASPGDMIRVFDLSGNGSELRGLVSYRF